MTDEGPSEGENLTPGGGTPKRERQKARRDEKRRAQAEEAARRRRNRTITLAAVTALLVGAITAIVFLTTQTTEEAQVAPSPPPDSTPETGVACGGEVPEAAGEDKAGYDAPQEQDLSQGTVWRLETSCGTVDVELAVGQAPETTNSIAFLTSQGFFDGLTFHRVVPDFVIQGGDPEGTGTGGPGYQVVEPPPEGITYEVGTVAMAKAGPDPDGASGSQFFIVTGSGGANLPPQFALVGEVVDGLDVAQQIEGLSQGDGPPAQSVYIERATIVEG